MYILILYSYVNEHKLNILIFHSDIDECVQGLHRCDHNCTNTAGSHYCSCMDGYILEPDNHTCAGND